MKTIILIICVLPASCKNHHGLDITDFKSERISKTATILLNSKIENVFPLFGAFEERKWSKEWKPSLIYPDKEIIEEGTTFRTVGHGHDENEFVWRISKYEAEKYLIQYFVSSENRNWTITIKCNPSVENSTTAEITYTFTGLNKTGNQINEYFLHAIYKHNLKDWEEEINNYIKIENK